MTTREKMAMDRYQVIAGTRIETYHDLPTAWDALRREIYATAVPDGGDHISLVDTSDWTTLVWF